MANWEKIREEWESSEITFKDLADKHGLKDSTIRSRKNREKWSREEEGRNATKTATQRKRVATKKEPVVKSGELTDKQRLFCIYYIKYFNATKAYQKAYGCAYSTAMVEGHRHLRNPKISVEIDRLKEERLAEKKLAADDVLQKYIDIAFADVTDFVEFGRKAEKTKVLVGFDDDKEPIYEETQREYNYVDFKNHDEVDGTILSEVRQGKDGIGVKLLDKMKALDFLSKYTDMLPEAQKRKLEEEKLKMEISQLRGDTDGDAHEQGSSYEEALNAQVEDVFADEVEE